MKTEISKICALLTGLVVIAAAQDMSATVFGAKPPLLLMFGCFAGVPAAVGSGLFADALGGTPFGCSAAIFAVISLAVRAARRISCFTAAAAAALYELWISLWGGTGGFQAVSAAFVMAAAAAPVFSYALAFAKKRMGLEASAERKAA